MNRQARNITGLVGAVLALSLLAYALGMFDGSVPSSPLRFAPDLSKHPVYSGYQFGHEDKVIDIGTQPLFLPGVISQVMKRDTILKSVLAERGMEARFHAFLKGVDVNFFLASGDLEVGIGGDMPTLLACSNLSVLVASLIDQHFSAIVARQPLMIPELKGKRIGYAYGSQAHHALLDALASGGLGPADVNMIPMDVNRMPDALQDGSIDAFSAWEPTPAIAMSKYPELVSIARALTTGYLYFSPSLVQNSPEISRLVVASQLRAMAWIVADADNLLLASSWALDAGRKIGGDADGISAEVLSSAVNKGLLGISSSAFIADKSMAEHSALFREFLFLKDLALIPENTSWNDINNCFDRGLVPEIISHAEQYQLYVGDFVEDTPGYERHEQ